MVLGPCGSINPSASCMIDNRCSKLFPKKFYSEITIDEDGSQYIGERIMADLLKEMVSNSIIDL